MDEQRKHQDDQTKGSDHGEQGRADFHTGSTTQGGSNFGQGSSHLAGNAYQQGDTAGGGTSYENEAGRFGSSAEGAPASGTGGVRTGPANQEGALQSTGSDTDAASEREDGEQPETPDREPRGTSLEQQTNLDEENSEERNSSSGSWSESTNP